MKSQSLLLLAAVGALVSSSPAEAQFKISIPGVNLPGGLDPASAERQLRSIDENIVQKGYDALPSSFGRSVREEEGGIERAEAHVKEAKKAMTMNLKLAMGAYGEVEKRIKDLEERIVQAKAAHQCTIARVAIVDDLSRTVAVDDDAFKKLEAAVRSFEKTANADFKPVVDYFKGEVDNLRKENERIKEVAKKQMVAQLSREEAKRVQEIGQRANGARAALFDALNKHQAITDEQLSALETAASELKTVNAPSAALYYNDLELFSLYASWNKSDGDAQKTIAKSLGGNVAVGGKSKSKALNVDINAKPGHCYVMLSKWETEVGTEKIENFKWSVKGARVQEFTNSWAGNSIIRPQGFCTTGKAAVTASAELVFPGSKNALRYVVVEMKKASFPMAMARNIGLRFGDPCDIPHWESFWKDPVPGTLAYRGNEPVLISYADAPGGNRDVHYMTIARSDFNARKSDLQTAPPETVAVATQFKPQGCWRGDGAEAPVSKQIEQCIKKIDKKYDKDWEHVEAQREAAGRRGLINLAAEEQAERLRNKWDDDFNKLCRPMEDKAMKAQEKSFTKLVDYLTDKAPKDSLTRAEALAEEETAPFRRW